MFFWAGGIFLGRDVYLVRSLDNYRRYEMVVGMNSKYIENRIIMAHKNARLLPLWFGRYNNMMTPNQLYV